MCDTQCVKYKDCCKDYPTQCKKQEDDKKKKKKTDFKDCIYKNSQPKCGKCR